MLSGQAYHWAFRDNVPPVDAFLAVGFTSALIFALVSKALGQYDVSSLIHRTIRFQSLIGTWCISFLMLAAVLFVLKVSSQYSRGSMIVFAFMAPLFLVIVRQALSSRVVSGLRTGVVRGHEGIVIGTAEELSRVSEEHVLETFGTRILGRFELPGSLSENCGDADAAVLERAVEYARANEAERVILALPWSQTVRLRAVAEHFRVLPVSVSLLADRVASEVMLPSRQCDNGDLAVELSRAPLSFWEQTAKRLLDIVVVALGALALVPVFLVIALSIKATSRGPVFFRQDRIGFNGSKFSIFKFRTMTVMENGPVVRQATKDDDRVTRVGCILRKTSLDELPQLLNVLRGDMSLVGPRPHAIAHHNEYECQIAKYAFRHNVKPGITGWAQVNGLRGATPKLEMMASRVDADLWYIANWSFWLDVKILFLTILEVMRRRNAY